MVLNIVQFIINSNENIWNVGDDADEGLVHVIRMSGCVKTTNVGNHCFIWSRWTYTVYHVEL